MDKIGTILLALAILIVGLFLTISVRDYLQNKNEIEARNFSAQCIAQMKQAQLDWGPCADIKNYKSASVSKF